MPRITYVIRNPMGGWVVCGEGLGIQRNCQLFLRYGEVLSLLQMEYTFGHCLNSLYQEFRAPLTVVADGCFSNLRKTLVSARPQNKSNFAGLVMHNCPQTRDHFAEVILASPAPVLVYQISSDSTRVLVDIPGQKMPADAKTYLLETVAPQLPGTWCSVGMYPW